jgi:alpha-ketoglutarate-dependent taurine dioxygenase
MESPYWTWKQASHFEMIQDLSWSKVQKIQSDKLLDFKPSWRIPFMRKIQPLSDKLGALLVCEGSHDSIMDLDTEEVRALLPKYGAVVLRGFEPDMKTFRSFTDRFSKEFVKHRAPDLREAISEDQTVTGVLTGNDTIFLHGEMYYLPETMRPDLLWLFCEFPAKKDGETTICDSAALLQNLSPASRELFMKKKIRYNHRLTLQQMKASIGIDNTEHAILALRHYGLDKYKITGSKDNPVLHFSISADAIRKLPNGKVGFINSIANMSQYPDRCRVDFDDGTPMPESVLKELIEIGTQTELAHKWQPNEILLVDNSWVLHGRRSFVGERVISTRFALSA